MCKKKTYNNDFIQQQDYSTNKKLIFREGNFLTVAYVLEDFDGNDPLSLTCWRQYSYSSKNYAEMNIITCIIITFHYNIVTCSSNARININEQQRQKC